MTRIYSRILESADDNTKVDPKVAAKLRRTRKLVYDMDRQPENVVAILGQFDFRKFRDHYEAYVQFGYVYKDGSFAWSVESIPIGGMYSKVKKIFADIWDDVDWMWDEELAKMETSEEVVEALLEMELPYDGDFDDNVDEWLKTHYPTWWDKHIVRKAIEWALIDYKQPGEVLELPEWFKPNSRQKSIFNDVLEDLVNGRLNTIKGMYEPEMADSIFVLADGKNID